MRRQETTARLEKEKRQEEEWRQEEAWRQQEAERRAAEREKVDHIRRAIEGQEQQQRKRLWAEERCLQEMAERQLGQKNMDLAAQEQRREREAMEMAERQRRLAVKEQQRFEYQHMMEERRMLLQQRHQLDILERQEHERLCFMGSEMEQGVFRRQEHERGQQFRHPCPPRQQSNTAQYFVGYFQDNDDIVNPLYSNYHPMRGRGMPRARGTGIPPPHMPPANYYGPVGYNGRRGSGFSGIGGGSHGLPCPAPPPRHAAQNLGAGRGGFDRHGLSRPVPPPQHTVQNRGAGRGGFEGKGRSHLVPPQSEPPPPGEELSVTGKGCGGDGRRRLVPKTGYQGEMRRGDCLPPTTAGDCSTQKTLCLSVPPPPVTTKTPTSLKEHFENLQVQIITLVPDDFGKISIYIYIYIY